MALAKLHAVPVAAAEAAEMVVRTPAQARQKVADDIDRVRRELAVNDKRLNRWQRWLDDDTSWPDFCVVVHGDLYVGHVLVDDSERVTGMIDWSECRVDDPFIDMTSHLMVFGEAGLAKLIGGYQAAGGRVWPRMAHHIAERLAVSPVTYALFGLDSGHHDHLAAAERVLHSVTAGATAQWAIEQRGELDDHVLAQVAATLRLMFSDHEGFGDS